MQSYQKAPHLEKLGLQSTKRINPVRRMDGVRLLCMLIVGVCEQDLKVAAGSLAVHSPSFAWCLPLPLPLPDLVNCQDEQVLSSIRCSWLL